MKRSLLPEADVKRELAHLPRKKWLLLLTEIVVLACFLVGLYHLDLWLSEDDQGGTRRMAIRRMSKHVSEKPHARIAIIGQSTIVEWLGERGTLATVFGVPAGDVVNAHINACDYTGNYAEVRRMLADGRHYERVFFGNNLYQMCEDEHTWRIYTPLALMPKEELPELFEIWLQSRRPLSYYGRALMMSVSSALKDPIAARDRMRTYFDLRRVGNPGRAAGWARPNPTDSVSSPTCGYEQDDVALKTEVVKHLLPALTELADEVFYLVLPDRSLGTPQFAEAARRFVSHQRELARAVPGVRFIDMVTDGAKAPEHFKDAAHLNDLGKEVQTALLRRQLHDMGVL